MKQKHILLRIGKIGGVGVLTTLGLISIIATNGDPNVTTPPNCTTAGSRSVFVATFENDVIGSVPTPAPPPANNLQYGPPGANLIIQGQTGTVQVVDSAVLGSKALSITRGAAQPTIVKAIAGKINNEANKTGTYYIRYRAHGEVIPAHLIAGIATSAYDEKDNGAVLLKLFNNTYHARMGDNYNVLAGSYDPGVAHTVQIELNFSSKTYSVCVDGSAVLANSPFYSQNFSEIDTLRFFAPQTITEAFPATLVVDDIRITK